MLAFYIIGGIILGIILLVTIILLLPVKLEVKFEDDLFLKLKFLGMTIYDSDEIAGSKKMRFGAESKTIKEILREKELDTFSALREKRGLKGAISEVFKFLWDFLVYAKPEIFKLKFRKFTLDLIVVDSEGDAAATAIQYGEVCSVVYPILSFIDQNLDVKFKRINVDAGFRHTESIFKVVFDIRGNVILVLILLYKALEEYKNLCVRNELL